MEMTDEVTFPLMQSSYKYIKLVQISLSREIYKAVWRTRLFCHLPGIFGFIFLLTLLPWLVSCPHVLTSAPPILCLVC